jgi:hypothetical protein
VLWLFCGGAAEETDAGIRMRPPAVSLFSGGFFRKRSFALAILSAISLRLSCLFKSSFISLHIE